MDNRKNKTDKDGSDLEYLPIKESQIVLFKDTALYYQTKDQQFSLYKKSGEALDASRLDKTRHPDLFIRLKDKDASIQEIVTALNNRLTEQCLSEDLVSARDTLTLIVSEAIQNSDKIDSTLFPETIDILFKGYIDSPRFFEAMTNIRTTAPVVIEHTINVMLLIFRFCFFHEYGEKQTKQLVLSALLHDIGTSVLDEMLLEKRDRLTEEEYTTYKGHTVKGYDLLNIDTKIDPVTAAIALEHHERIDGSGYPFAKTDISVESQLLGLIDCYEFLTYREKTHRKIMQPFESLDLIKQEVLKGRFDKRLFKKFCSSLGEV